MYLKSLRMRDFAGVADREVPLFAPGLNVVVGDNEAGKSTILTALRAAIFQRHRGAGESVRALASYGRDAGPEISIEFETGGVHYALRKAFLKKQMAELAWAGGRLSGDAVEEKLAELFGFAHPQKGESHLQRHQGAFGLLWVEQGRAPGGIDLGAGRNAVAASLEGEVGRIIGGERGSALLEAARGLQDRFFTPGRLTPAKHSPISKAEDELKTLRDELDAKRALRRAFEDGLARLSQRRASLRSYLSEDAVGRAEAALSKAQARARGLDAVRHGFAEAERELAHANALQASALDALERRREAGRRRVEAERVGLRAGEAFAELKAEAAGAQAGREAGEERLRAARGAAEAAEAALEVAERGERIGRLRTEAARLRQSLEQASAVAGRIRALEEASRGPRIDAKALAAIEAAARGRLEAEIRLSAAAPTLEFRPEAERRILDEDGIPVDAPDGRLRVTGRRVLRFEGFGRVVVTPGGEAGDVARAFHEADARLGRLLAAAAVESVDAARVQEREARERAGDLALARAELARLAPEGLAALEARCLRLAEEIAEIDAEGVPADGAADGEFASHLDAARALRRAAQDEARTAEAALDAARAAAGAWAARLARAEADSVHAGDAARRLAAELDAAEAERPALDLERAVDEAEWARKSCETVLAVRRRALDASDPDTVSLDLKRREDALRQIRCDVDALRGEVIRLEGELGAQGASALGEDIARLEGEIEVLGPRVERLRLQARAARLLHATLETAQREARESWIAPIRKEVDPFLRMIQPGTSVTFDEDTFDVVTLRRNGFDESFGRLSHGAREQIAVVTRLALATVLRKGGYPAAVILDDALVNTDERRLERMHLVLRQAAETLQIIVLTCRERDFRDLGAPIIRL